MNTTTVELPQKKRKAKPEWTSVVAKYQSPIAVKSIVQIVTGFAGFFAMWYLMYLSMDISYWLTLALAPIATGFMVRIFIIQHDCGHGSFFNSRKANDSVGFLCGVFTLIPYFYWRKSHSMHHAKAGNLDYRGVGDITTITVSEYEALSPLMKLRYRMYRNPLVIFGIGPLFMFVLLFRFTYSDFKAWKNMPFYPNRRERNGVYFTDLGIAIVIAAVIFMVGWQAFLMIQLPITILTASIGTWLFFVQHQYEEAYWEKDPNWDYTAAALQGSSYYKLPKVLQWYTGNIGFHHIHHLSPRIPNYRLEECHKDNPLFQNVVTLTIRSSLKSTFLSLWDEENKKLISFGEYKKYQKQAISAKG